MAHLLIWSSLAFLVFVHFGYPLVLLVQRRLASQPLKKGFWEPTVSILIAVPHKCPDLTMAWMESWRDTETGRIRNMRKALLVPYTFNLLNLASVAALYHFMRRTAISDIWTERASMNLDKALSLR